MERVHEKIKEWFASGCDFDEGIALLQQVNRNTYYVNNIRRARKQNTLEYELKRVLIKAGVKEKKGLTIGTVGTSKPVRTVETVNTVGDRKGGGKGGDQGGGKDQGGGEKPGRVWSIREEFPFLEAADCPDELKILVADMITTHKNYVTGHESLFAVVHKGPAACYEAARVTVENYLENRRIWKELEYYKKHGKLLGEHPIFSRRKKEQELLTMTYPELKKFRKNIIRQIDYRKKKDDLGKSLTIGTVKTVGSESLVGNVQREIEELKKQLAQVTVLIEKYEQK